MSGGTIAVIATGGTLANTPAGRVSIDEVLADVRRASGDLVRSPLQTHEVFREGSDVFEPNDWLRLGGVAQKVAEDPDVSGLVITHGTYSVEEAAYFLHLALDTPKPVVFAVSQRMHTTLSNDGDRNLVDAIRAAASLTARRVGVLVAVNEELHSAREVRKTSQRPGGFSSGSLGILGSLEEDAVSIYRRPTRRHTYRSRFRRPQKLPRVDIISAYVGADAALTDAAITAGASGIVVAGFSYRGLPHPSQQPALDRAAEAGIPVVFANRGLEGRVPVQPGSPYISGDNLSPQKARILLMLALGAGSDRADLQDAFSTH
jgi:L-asparaginase